MAAGDIGLTEITGDVGKAIRVGQKLNGDGFSRFEHAFVDMGDGTIVEAQPGGAVHTSNYHDPTKTIYLICPPALGNGVAIAAMQYTGVGYSFLDYAALAARRLRIPAPHLRAYIANTGHMICSQLADQAASDGGWRLFSDGRWPGDVTPGALWRLAGLTAWRPAR